MFAIEMIFSVRLEWDFGHGELDIIIIHYQPSSKIKEAKIQE